MTRNDIYNRLKKIQSLAWRGDDLMEQDTLFEMQDYIASLILDVAEDCGKTDDLVQSFPWLYEQVEVLTSNN